MFNFIIYDENEKSLINKEGKWTFNLYQLLDKKVDFFYYY